MTFLPVASVSLAIRLFMPGAIAQLAGEPPIESPSLETPARLDEEIPAEPTPVPSAEESPAKPPQETCRPASAPSTAGLTRLVSDLSQTAALVEQPAIGMGTLIGQVGPRLMAYFNASPFPEINAQARLARVPVMMYHDIRPDKQVFLILPLRSLSSISS